MTSIVTPSNQTISIDPYSGKLFDFDNASSRIYLSRAINNLLRTFGTDVVLEGLNITNLSYDSVSETVTFKVSPGKCIIDTTLIEYPTESDLSINVSGYDDLGVLLVIMSYRYSETIHNNVSKFKVLYLDPTERYTYPTQIELNTERIILKILKFNKVSNIVNISNINNLSIGSKTFEVYPLTNIAKSSKAFISNLFN